MWKTPFPVSSVSKYVWNANGIDAFLEAINAKICTTIIAHFGMISTFPLYLRITGKLLVEDEQMCSCKSLS